MDIADRPRRAGAPIEHPAASSSPPPGDRRAQGLPPATPASDPAPASPLPAPVLPVSGKQGSFLAALRARFGGLKHRHRPRIGSLTPRQLLALHLMATIGPAVRSSADAGGKYRIGNSGHVFQEATFAALIAKGYARTAYGRGVKAAIVPTLHGRRIILAASSSFHLPEPGRPLPPAGVFF